MRRQDDVLEREELLTDVGLVLVDVESGAGDDALAEGRDQCPLVDDRASRGVHEDGGRTHPLERGAIDQVMRVRGERQMEAHHVG